MANILQSVSRPDEESSQDHAGSNDSTPPGFATPQPDPSDKRLPGIMHSYFGQVRSPSTIIQNFPGHSVLANPAVDVGIASCPPEHHRAPEGQTAALPTAPNSPTEQVGEENESPMLLPHERLRRPLEEELLGQDGSLAYPTPPISSPSSLHKEAPYESPRVDGLGGGDGPGAIGRRTRLRGSFTETIPPSARRKTFALNPLSSITTSPTVHAAHILNPSSRYPSTTPTTPTSGDFAASALSSLSSHLENIKLTEDAALSSRVKSTPPQTPRALSNDATSSDLQSPAPSTKPALSNLSNSTTNDSKVHSAAATGGTTTPVMPNAGSTSAPVGPPKGKLSVMISEARGLRPSYDPYVVCVFEWNEYISRGPKMEEVDMDREDALNKDDGIGGVAIRRSGSDMGRPVAIPMKSRQSSTASLSDQKDLRGVRQVTDPKWNHEAILSVSDGRES